MGKGVRFKSISLVFIFTLVIEMFVGINFKPLEVGAKEVIPKVGIVSLDHSPFKEGDKNSFFISTKEYSGQVQYQLFYTCKTTMGNDWELIHNDSTYNGWTKSVDAKVPVEFDISELDLKSDNYRFAIRVRRVGVKGKFSNQYGDYDSAYPFNLNVVKNVDIDLSGDMLLEKTVYTQGESIKIEGVKATSNNAKFKLHIYDVNNNKWMTNITEYNKSISYNTNNLPAGYYILDIWGKSEGSNKQYDGWKLKTIEVKRDNIPEIGIVSLDHTPFIEGDKNEFYITSKDYTGQVQYQLFYTNKATMGTQWKVINNNDTVDGWTKAVDSKEPITFDISGLNLKAEAYRFAIRVKRVGVKGKYSNQYGDYDCAYPFNLNVVKSGTVKLNGDMLIDKANYAKNDNLVINGVRDAASNVQYKLHLYDVKNNKWLTDLTGYSNKIDYDLSNIPEGVYIVDIWGKNSNSSSKYEGWKLKTINIGSEVKTILNAEEIYTEVFRGKSFTLPKTVLATFEDGTKANKTVIWHDVVNTSRVGVYNFEGSISGYDKKVNLKLTVKEGMGNSSGNIINLGMVAEKDGWVYFPSDYDEGKLYKSKQDGSSITKVSEDSAIYINIRGEWIYYCNLSDKGKLYKIKLDGSNRTKISDDVAEQVTVDDKWIYYANATDKFSLYKISIDGTNRKKLNSDFSLNLNLDNDYIYYTNNGDNNKIYKINMDGTGRVKLNNDQSGYINVFEGWIYYSNISDSSKIYKIRTNGTSRTKVSDIQATFINVSNEWIYYSNLTDESLDLYRMRITGVSNEILYKGESVLISVIGDYVYYGAGTDEYVLHSIKNNRSNLIKLGMGIGKIEDLNVELFKGESYALPKGVYAVQSDGQYKLMPVQWNVSEVDTSQVGEYTFEGTVEEYPDKVLLKLRVVEIAAFQEVIQKVRLVGSKFTLPNQVDVKLNDGTKKQMRVYWNVSAPSTSVAGEYSFEGVVDKYSGKIKLNLSVINSDKAVTGEILGEDSEWIYFLNNCDENRLYKIKKDGAEKTRVFENSVYVYTIKDGFIYYRENSRMFKIKTDGTGKLLLSNNTPSNIYKIINNNIYYLEDYPGVLYEVNMLTNENKKITTDAVDYSFTVDNGWAYYTNNNDNDRLYKVKLDGTSRTRLSLEKAYSPQVIDGFLYYSTDDLEDTRGFFKVKLDGTNKQVISSNTTASKFKIIGEWVYFVETIHPGNHASPVYKARISKFKRGTTEIIPLTDILYNGLEIVDIIGDKIYYYNSESNAANSGIANTDGTGNTKIPNLTGKIYYVKDGWAYYANYEEDGLLYKIRLDGTENQLVA